MAKSITFEPQAKNDLASDHLFVQRKYYNTSDEIYPTNVPKPIDIWYKKPLFGKVDTIGRYVYPDPVRLKPIRNNQSVLNFVADAYTDFANTIAAAVNGTRTCISSFIDVTTPVKAWVDINVLYDKYFVTQVNDPFVNGFLADTKTINKIVDFKDYMTQILAFVLASPETSFTKTSFLASNDVGNNCSGLIIEFANDQYDNDNWKWKNYLSNDFFEEYVHAAGAFGFYVNKHVPWSIVANLNSKAMKRYMEGYGLYDASQMFVNYYYQSEYISFEAFKRYLFASYTSFVEDSPFIEKVKVFNCIRKPILGASKFNTVTKKIPRKKEFTESQSFEEVEPTIPFYEDFEKKYSNAYLFDKYIDIRLIETGFKVFKNKYTYDKIKKATMKVLYSKDIYDATIFLSEAILSHKNYLTSLKENNSL